MATIATDEEWLAARHALLQEEKALQRARDQLAEKRRRLPWRRVESDYDFEGADGRRSLSDLFGNASQLLIYHFMYHADWDEGCKTCSFWADGFDGAIPHLYARDVAFAVISRGPLDKLLSYRQRMGWQFPWFSSADSTFNYDFGVSFTAKQIESGNTFYNFRDGASVGPEMPGISTFARDGEGSIFHTYSTYSRGLDPLNSAYQLLDLVAKGRDEDQLPFPMDWLRRHDEY
ncbi:MAG: thioredoxin family protein [Woeseiaceae bacterium]